MRLFLSLALVVFLAFSSSPASASRRSPQEFQRKLDTLTALVKATEHKWATSPDTKCVGGASCCKSRRGRQCGIGEGNCRRDSECMDGLVCGDRGNCNGGVIVPLYEHWAVPGGNFDGSDRCCTVSPQLVQYFENYRV